MATIKRFEDLEIWQEARVLAKECYRLSLISKDEADYDLMNALPKTGGSVMDNIAEGFGRGGNKEFGQFLSVAHGSCSELKSQLYRFMDRPYSNENLTDLVEKSDVLMSRINAFQEYLKRSVIKGYKYKEDDGLYVTSDSESSHDQNNV